jgi:hypothetical protein
MVRFLINFHYRVQKLIFMLNIRNAVNQSVHGRINGENWSRECSVLLIHVLCIFGYKLNVQLSIVKYIF